MKKALTILAVVLLLGFGVLRGLYQWASRDIPPPDDSEFLVERPVVAPEDNAYTYFLQATNFFYSPTNCTLISDYLAGKPVEEAEIRELVEKNGECLALLKRGTECSICLMPLMEDFLTLTPYISPWLGMGRILLVKSRQARLEGRYTESVDSCAVGIRFGYLIQKDASCLIVHLVGVALLEMYISQIEDLVWDPGVPTEDLARLATILDEIGSLDDGLTVAMKAEYHYTTSIIDFLQKHADQAQIAAWLGEENSLPNALLKRMRGSSYFFQPNRTKQRFADFYRHVIQDIPRVYSEMAFPEIPEESVGFWHMLRPNGVAYILQAILEPATETVLKNKCEKESTVSGTRLVVACNRFEREEGRWPESLQELVPEYLDAVPVDPFDGELFRYSPEKSIVYSVGRNLTDEGGSSMMPDGKVEGETGWRHKNAEDLVFGIMAR